MLHHTPLITTIAAALGLALIMGFIAARLKLPALVGYLLAGIIIGPFTPGFVADTQLAGELAEIGVMLLMFGVGLHFSLDDLMLVRKIAIPGALIQISVATGLGALLAIWWGWNLGAALVFGLALSVASTVVLLRALEASGSLDSMNGRIAVGWLIVEDLAMVLVLVLLPPLAGLLSEGPATQGSTQIGYTLGITLLKVTAFVVLMLGGGQAGLSGAFMANHPHWLPRIIHPQCGGRRTNHRLGGQRFIWRVLRTGGIFCWHGAAGIGIQPPRC